MLVCASLGMVPILMSKDGGSEPIAMTQPGVSAYRIKKLKSAILRL